MGFGDGTPQRGDHRPAAIAAAACGSERLFAGDPHRAERQGACQSWLKGQGVESREVIPNAAYFIRDPEGNPIELYTPPKP